MKKKLSILMLVALMAFGPATAIYAAPQCGSKACEDLYKHPYL
ncbi:hypothetical protein [Metasolibacillus sp. FSL K6-0083]